MNDKIKAVTRVLIMFLISVIVWRIMLIFIGRQDVVSNTIFHIIVGIVTSVLTSILIVIMARIENKNFDLSLQTHVKNFTLGFICWILPALIGISFFVITGHINIVIQAPAHTLILQTFTLFTTVFFIEAFPEEIIRSYIFSSLEKPFSAWVALLVQTALFTLFAFCIGALYSIEQISFIPGFGFLLCYFRMLSGSALFSMGFHTAIMTITQLLTSSSQLVIVDGSFFVIRFLCFILLPAIVSSIFLHINLLRTN